MRRVASHCTCSTITAGSSFAPVKHLITTLTCVARATFAAVAVGELYAVVRTPGVTGVRQALIDVSFTALANVARRTHALVASDAVDTFSVVEALGLMGGRVIKGVAIIQIDLTVDPLGSSGAGALVCVDQIDASPTILAGLRLTFIDFLGAIDTMVARKAFATVSSKVISARGTVLARIRGALVYLFLTVTAGVTSLAAAVMCVPSIKTLPRIPTQVSHFHTLLFCCDLAGHTGDIAVESSPTSLALAVVGGTLLPT